jgi:Ca2+-binding EF-hand superfamily protein
MDLKFLFALLICSSFASAAPQLPSGAIAQIPAWLDTDGDGVVSELERHAFAEARKNGSKSFTDQWDDDDDDELDENEQEFAMTALAEGARRKLGELFSNVAGDDGLLSLEEFTLIPAVSDLSPEKINPLFDLLDTDKDSLVSLDEFITNTGGPRLRKGQDKPGEGSGGGAGGGAGGTAGGGSGGAAGSGASSEEIDDDDTDDDESEIDEPLAD